MLTITGAGGFVGQRLLSAAEEQAVPVQTVSLRKGFVDLPEGDALIHLAAIAHTGHPDSEAVYAVNRDLAVRVAESARAEGYEQFVFLSSALVWGSGYECVELETPEKPDTDYGKAKLQAEERIRAMETESFNVAVVRPPLVFGPGVKGNLAKLLHSVHRWPLCPLGTAENRRSLLHVDNLAAFLFYLADRRIGGTFAPADEPPLSSREILEKMARRMPEHGRVVSMPRPVRALLGAASPRIARSLFGSFVVNSDSVSDTGFDPPFSIDDGFDKMVGAYLATHLEKGRK